MPYIVRSTRVADRQIVALRGPRRKKYDEFERALARDGCAALDYRLTGDDPLPQLCVKHLRGNDRAVIAFADDVAWVLLVGPHTDGDTAADVYGTLYELADIRRPTQPRMKPPCCTNQQPPELDETTIDDLVRRGRALRR